MDVGVVVELLQVNIALGILYVGLREFRFRERLYHNMVKAISESGFVGITKSQETLASLFQENMTFGVNFHTIRDWILALPDSEREKIDKYEELKFPPAREDRNEQELQTRSRFWMQMHNGFLNNEDKYIVWWTSIIPAMVWMWVLLWWSDSNTIKVISAILAIVGLVAILGMWALGRQIAQKSEKEVQSALDYIMNRYRELKAASDVTEAATKLDKANDGDSLAGDEK